MRYKKQCDKRVRDSFPLHFTVFKQCPSHPPHEARVEQLFSRSGKLSDPNMDPEFLSTLTSIAGCEQEASRRSTKPTVSETMDMYFKMYHGKGAEASIASDVAGS
eukprot:3825636-Prymnesium_polylepis.1